MFVGFSFFKKQSDSEEQTYDFTFECSVKIFTSLSQGNSPILQQTYNYYLLQSPDSETPKKAQYSLWSLKFLFFILIYFSFVFVFFLSLKFLRETFFKCKISSVLVRMNQFH